MLDVKYLVTIWARPVGGATFADYACRTGRGPGERGGLRGLGFEEALKLVVTVNSVAHLILEVHGHMFEVNRGNGGENMLLIYKAFPLGKALLTEATGLLSTIKEMLMGTTLTYDKVRKAG